MIHIKKIVPLIIIILIFFVTGCKNSSDVCKDGFTATFNGTVSDNNGNPVDEVSVDIIALGTRGLLTETDKNGEYLKHWHRAAKLGLTSLVFYKSGYKEYESEAKSIGDNCEDITITTNAVLEEE